MARRKEEGHVSLHGRKACFLLLLFYYLLLLQGKEAKSFMKKKGASDRAREAGDCVLCL